MPFFFTCLYLVFLLLRPQEWLMVDILPDNMMDVMVIGAVILLLVDAARHRETWPKRLPHLLLMTGFFASVLLADIVQTNFSNLSINVIEFGKLYVVFTLVLVTTNTPRRVRIMSGLIVGMALLVVYHCYLQVTTGFGFGMTEPMYLRGRETIFVRAMYFGIMGDPNDTALFLTFAMPLTFTLFSRRRIWAWGLAMAIALTIAYGVLLTESRGGYLAMGMMGFVTLAQFLNRRWFVVMAVITGMLLIVALPSRLSSLGIYHEDRSNLWGEANQVFKAHPITGIGANRIAEYLSDSKVPHNSFIHVYSELGLLGYILWMSLMLFSVIGCWYVSRLTPETDDDFLIILQAKGLLASLVGFAAASYFLSRSYFVPLYVLLGMAAAVYRLAGIRLGLARLNEHCGAPRHFGWLYPALCMGSIFAIYLSILTVNRLM